MAVTNEELFNIFVANPNMSDSQIVSLMETRGISPEQVSSTFNIPVGQVAARVAEVIPPNQAVLLGDTYVQAQNQVIGSGMDQQVGGLQNVVTYKAVDNKVGGDVKFYSPTGEFQQTTKQQEVNATKDFVKFLAGSAALFGGAALAGGGAETFAGEALADANLLAGGGTTLGGTTFAGEALADAGLLSGGAATTLGGATFAGEALADAGLLSGGGGALTGGAATTLGGGAATTLGGATALDGAATLGGASTLGGAATNLGAASLGATLGGVAGAGLTAAQIAALVSTGALTGAGVLQTETARKAAVKAQEMIDAETAAAKAAAQFRPIGMTTRFGSSKFGFDPVTGQLTSAGYTLSPEAKAAQDRFVKLAESGLVQAEGAQEQFKPLQTGATSLFTLGNKYLAQTPETVASDYMKSQLALLKPGRDLELANIETRLRNQGRLGLSVAQGGNLGATTPELQALYNARAQQEAQLAANAQQYGQQNVLFGAGLLGQGATAMGNYYGGQQQAYTPYTTALGQVTGLESAAQQPLSMGMNIGQTAAQAGFNVGQLGLKGAGQSVALATSPAATTNPYATLLSGLFS